MPLQGTFDVLPFADVLELLANRSATGRLHVRSRATGANIYLDKGRLVGAQVGEQTTTGSQDVQSRLGEVSFELLEAERGSFEFNPDLTGMGQPTLDLGVGEVLEAARKQLEEWREIQTVVPSVDVHPSLVAELAAEQVTVSRDQWRVLSALDGRRSVRAVARLLDLSDYRVSSTTKSLIEVGVVELDAPSRPAPTAGRDVTVIVDDLVEWAPEPSGNGDTNGKTDADGPSDRADPDPIVDQSTVAEASVPKTVVPPPLAGGSRSLRFPNGDADSIWSGNVEDRPAIAPAPPAPPKPVAPPSPPAPAPAPPVARAVPIHQPETRAAEPSKPRWQGLFGLGRKDPSSRPNA